MPLLPLLLLLLLHRYGLVAAPVGFAVALAVVVGITDFVAAAVVAVAVATAAAVLVGRGVVVFAAAAVVVAAVVIVCLILRVRHGGYNLRTSAIVGVIWSVSQSCSTPALRALLP